jgi:hypothetical protein
VKKPKPVNKAKKKPHAAKKAKPTAKANPKPGAKVPAGFRGINGRLPAKTRVPSIYSTVRPSPA